MKLGREFYTRDGITVARELLGKILVHETSMGTVRGIITETESYMGEEDKGSHTYGGKRTRRTEPMYHIGGTSYVYLIYGMYSCMNIAAMTEGIPQAVLIRKVEPADEDSRHIMEQLRLRQGKGRHDRGLAGKPTSGQPETPGSGAVDTAMAQSEADQGVGLGVLPELRGGDRQATPGQTENRASGHSVDVKELPVSIRKHLADGPGKMCIAMEITRDDNDIDMVESDTFYVTEGIQAEPEQIKAGKRIGIDYAGEAADYLWRFYL